MKLLNKYTFFARYIPGLITLLPASSIYFFVTKEYVQYRLSEYLISVPFFFGVSATFIITYFVSMITRELGSFIEAKYFHSKSGFPTTYNMLWADGKLSKQDKRRYAEKVDTEFKLKLLNEQQEMADPQEAVKILNQVSRLLSTKYQQHEQVRDANIAYGFSRNVSGGSFISFPLAIIGIMIGIILHMPTLIFWSSCFAVFFIFIIVFHKIWLTRNAEKYAEKIFSVFFQR